MERRDYGIHRNVFPTYAYGYTVAEKEFYLCSKTNKILDTVRV
jgi:hypothetical protein